MKILVVGGTGMIGGHAALYLHSRGHEVAIAGRNPPAAGTPLGGLEFLRCDYIEQPARRDEIMQQTVRIIDMLYVGALTMQSMKVDSMAELLAKQNPVRK